MTPNREDIIKLARDAGFDRAYVSEEAALSLLVPIKRLFQAAYNAGAAEERERIIAANAPEIEKINAHIKALEDERAAMMQLFTDPENQPTQHGTVTVKYMQREIAAEREACAELVWPMLQVKTWSDEELTAMTGAFNRAQEKHGWYETIMAVGAAALKGRAAAIRARGQA